VIASGFSHLYHFSCDHSVGYGRVAEGCVACARCEAPVN
jgi:hypothetical protein